MTVYRGADIGLRRAEHSESPTVGGGRHRKTLPRRSIRASWAIVAAVLAVGCVAGAVVGLTRATGGTDVPTAAVVSDPDRDVAEWVRANIPADARLLTDGPTAPRDLVSAPIGQPDQDWHDFEFLLTRPGDPPLDTIAAAVWQSSMPIATFPDAEIRRIYDEAPEENLRWRAADRADRLLAGTSLLGNPHVTPSASAAAVLTRGGLDLRAATALTTLASVMHVDLVDIEDIGAEAAAAMPARSMTIRVVDSARATAVLSGLTAAFRAEQVIATPDGAIRLHWPLRFTPLPSVN